jgi:hypothetical protein
MPMHVNEGEAIASMPNTSTLFKESPTRESQNSDWKKKSEHQTLILLYAGFERGLGTSQR